MTGLFLMAGIVGLGLVLKAPARLIAVALGMVWAGFVLVHLLFPGGGHPLPRAVGGSLPGWLGLGAVAVLVLAYRAMLRRLRARAPEPVQPTVPSAGSFSEAELDRYARHILLREIGGPGQKKLKGARVLVVGAGGLGSPVLLYLAAAGVGRIGVVDDDVVSSSNLQRQVIHRDADIGKPKVFSAEAAMRALNPFIEVRPYNRRLGAADARALVAEYDLVIDGTDNFTTRYLLNAACVAEGKPLLSGAISQWEGQLSLYDPGGGCALLCLRFPRGARAGACALLRRGGGDGRAARGDWRDDGGRGDQGDHRRGAGPARALADP